MVASFLRKGGTLSSSTMMNTVMLCAGASQSTLSTTAPKSIASIILLPANFPSLNGDIEEQESYKTKAKAQIGQTAFKFLVT
eukprot:15329937-Ditylum_brightwellii.AAC.1